MMQQENLAHQEKFKSEEQRTTQTSSLRPEDQDYWYYCSHSYVHEPSTETEKESRYRFYNDKKHTKKMDSLLCNTYDILNEYMNLKQRIDFNLFQNCKGIMILRLWKAGLFVGGIGGTGIVMAHHNGNWSGPCAVSVGGLQVGFHGGIERVDDILLLHDDAALRLLVEKGHFKLGVDASIAIGPFGRDANMGVVMAQKTESKSIYAYSFAKGAFIGLSLDGGVLSIDDKVNEEFYGRKIDIKDIFYQNVGIEKQDPDFMKVRELLNRFTSIHQTNITTSESLK